MRKSVLEMIAGMAAKGKQIVEIAMKSGPTPSDLDYAKIADEVQGIFRQVRGKRQAKPKAREASVIRRPNGDEKTLD